MGEMIRLWPGNGLGRVVWIWILTCAKGLFHSIWENLLSVTVICNSTPVALYNCLIVCFSFRVFAFLLRTHLAQVS
jgi:hypothetical protein